ncbi:MAG: regulatory protein RecX [Alcanivoracaceae bacterium]
MTESDADLRRAALDWLSRREYSRAELTRKLRRKFGAEVVLDELFQWLEEHRFLDESRYLDIMIRSSIGRGHGLLRLRQDLRQRGLPQPLVDQALASLDADWFELARQVRQRRFGLKPVIDQKEKARQLRYLQYRGFTGEQCFHALDMSEEDSQG